MPRPLGREKFTSNQAAEEYLALGLIEKALSLDNLIVFGMISTALKVEHKLQRRILNYGIVGAILFQLVFILGGYELLKQIFWVSIIFGVACVLSRSAWRARRISRSTKSKMWWVLSVLLPIHHSFDGHKLMTVVKASAG